jgi:phosphoglycerate dehydrogenase-like enzyme
MLQCSWEAGNLGVEKVSLNNLFGRSNIVTVHAPSIGETDKMIGAEQLKLLRDGATLINTSRGNVIDDRFSLLA